MPFTIATAYTLGEVLKGYDPQNKLHYLIDPFKDKRPIIEEGYWEEANGDTYHEMLRVASRPSGSHGRINQGYTKEGVATVPVKEQLANLQSLFELDKRLAKRQSDPGAWRAQRARAHIAGMISTFDSDFFLGDSSSDPDEVNGLAVRSEFNALADTDSVGNLEGSSYLYPVWIIQWGPEGCMLLYPKGGQTTFTEDDRGEVELYDSNSKPYPGYRSYFDFNYGIGIAQVKSVQRIVNCNYTEIGATATLANFENMIIERLEMMPSLENVAIYVGRQIMVKIRQRINSKSNVEFTPDNVWGRIQPTIQGCPIIKDDSLSTSESAVT